MFDIVRRKTDGRFPAKDLPRLLRRQILLSEVDAIGFCDKCDIDAVVDDYFDPGGVSDLDRVDRFSACESPESLRSVKG